MAEFDYGANFLDTLITSKQMDDDNVIVQLLNDADDDQVEDIQTLAFTNLTYIAGVTASHGQRTSHHGDLACRQFLRFIINSLFAGTLCLVGLVGNSTSYVVIGREKDIFPVSRLLLRSLAVADNVFIVLWLVQFSLSDLFTFIGQEKPDSFASSLPWLVIRLATYPLIFACQGITIWLTLLIAASRWASVCQPARAAAHCTLRAMRRCVGFIIVAVAVYNIPRYFEFRVQTRSTHRNVSGEISQVIRHQLVSTALSRNYFYSLVYRDILYYILSFFLPCVLLVAFNVRLIVAYRVFKAKRHAMLLRSLSLKQYDATDVQSSMKRNSVSHQHQSGSSKSEHNVTLIMIIIIVVFIACNAPGKVVQIWTEYREMRCATLEFFAREFSIGLELLSSSINFLIYYVFLKRFCHHLGRNPCRRQRSDEREEEEGRRRYSNRKGSERNTMLVSIASGRQRCWSLPFVGRTKVDAV